MWNLTGVGGKSRALHLQDQVTLQATPMAYAWYCTWAYQAGKCQSVRLSAVCCISLLSMRCTCNSCLCYAFTVVVAAQWRLQETPVMAAMTPMLMPVRIANGPAQKYAKCCALLQLCAHTTRVIPCYIHKCINCALAHRPCNGFWVPQQTWEH